MVSESIERVELSEPLAGRYVVIDRDAATVGVLEDIQEGGMTGRVKLMLDGFARIIVGGNLSGMDGCASLEGEQRTEAVRAALRQLRKGQVTALNATITAAFRG